MSQLHRERDPFCTTTLLSLQPGLEELGAACWGGCPVGELHPLPMNSLCTSQGIKPQRVNSLSPSLLGGSCSVRG